MLSILPSYLYPLPLLSLFSLILFVTIASFIPICMSYIPIWFYVPILNEGITSERKYVTFVLMRLYYYLQLHPFSFERHDHVHLYG